MEVTDGRAGRLPGRAGRRLSLRRMDAAAGRGPKPSAISKIFLNRAARSATGQFIYSYRLPSLISDRDKLMARPL